MRKIIFILLIASCSDSSVTTLPVNKDSVSNETLNLTDSLSASIDSLKILKPEVNKLVARLKEYKEQVSQYESQEADIVIKKVVDSSALISLRSKLNSANNEIARLNGELASVRYKPNTKTAGEVSALIQPAIETPDNNSLIVTLDGKSKRGDLPTENLTLYLIPYTKRTKDLMSYDSSCNELYATIAQYYNGIYFFNSVQPGKYLVKICTYMGNYKLIKKQDGKQSITMLVAPPIQ